MAIKTITICDGCGKELASTQERYCLFCAKTRTFMDATGSRDFNQIDLVICEDCTTNRLLPALEKLAAEREGREE